MAKGFGTIVVEYATRFKSQGLLIGVRGSNLVISSHILNRNFEGAMSTLSHIDFEEHIVRSHGMKIFSDHCRPFDELENVINRFTVMGKLKYDNIPIKNVTGKVVLNNVEITKAMQSQNANLKTALNSDVLDSNSTENANNNNSNNSELNLSNQEANKIKNYDIETQNITCGTPEFGVNLHSFMALIFSPYLNLVSRNYFSDKKHVSSNINKSKL